jgi:dipeptidyl aminopeptidase/acylaminoacyl peptidase
VKSIQLSIFTLVAVSVLTGCQPKQEAALPEVKSDDFRTYTAEEFYKTTSVLGSSINHDNTAVLVSSDETGIFNAYRVPLDGSEKTALTASTAESIYVNSWFPNDDRILYNADQGGDELDHVYVRNIDGSVIDLTPGENLKASFVDWHEGGKQFFVTTNERDPKYFDLYKYQISDYSRELVYENISGYEIGDISSNGRWLALTKANSNSDSDIFLIDLNSDDQTSIMVAGSAPQDVALGVYTFTPDNQKLIYASNADGEFNQAMSYNLKSQTHSLSYAADWDVSFSYFSEDGKYRVTGINKDAQTVLDIVDTATGQQVSLPDLPAGDLRGVNFSKDSSRIVFYLNSDTSPSNLFTYNLGADASVRLTDTGNPDLDESHLVAGEVKRFKSFDGLEIPGILYKPKQASMEKVPALILIHGGPGGQSRFGYSALTQHLVNNGYAVFKINNRGSGGYGKTFFHLDDKKHGDHDLKDVVYNKRYLQTIDWIDAEKIGVMGGSYGGYLTMAAMTFTDEFKVGVNIFGVTNWVRTLKNIPPYWEAARKSLYDELGDPETDEKRLTEISPVFFGHQVKSPVLVVQGANDPRVLQVESDEMVASIREAGTHVDYLLFDDEGHGFSKKDNRIEASNKYLSFLDEHLK